MEIQNRHTSDRVFESWRIPMIERNCELFIHSVICQVCVYNIQFYSILYGFAVGACVWWLQIMKCGILTSNT